MGLADPSAANARAPESNGWTHAPQVPQEGKVSLSTPTPSSVESQAHQGRENDTGPAAPADNEHVHATPSHRGPSISGALPTAVPSTPVGGQSGAVDAGSATSAHEQTTLQQQLDVLIRFSKDKLEVMRDIKSSMDALVSLSRRLQSSMNSRQMSVDTLSKP